MPCGAPEQIEAIIRQHGGEDVRLGIETGPMTTWLVHESRGRGVDVMPHARHDRAALKMQLNKTDQNDAERLPRIMRTGLVPVDACEVFRDASDSRTSWRARSTRPDDHAPFEP